MTACKYEIKFSLRVMARTARMTARMKVMVMAEAVGMTERMLAEAVRLTEKFDSEEDSGKLGCQQEWQCGR